jgi:phosphoadenosine phosphosulfate reductase
MGAALDLDRYEGLDAEALVDSVLQENANANACVTCSFQAEDMIVVRMLQVRRPQIPVLFLETGYHFAQTYEYRDRMAQEWNLNLQNVIPQITVAQQEAQFGILNQTNPTQCCQLRKVEPLMRSLEPFQLWFTGLRREQSPTRAHLKKVEQHRLPSGTTLLKISLLADWKWSRVWEYVGKHQLSYLPLYDQGYSSIGCEPCTAIPEAGSDARSGRWGGKKLECGIHTFSQKSK